jgi:hypothetical protein
MAPYGHYDGTPPHVAGSATSLAAALQVPDLNELHGRLLRLLSKGGMTDEELQAATDMNPSTQRPRRVELVEKKLVCDSQLRRRTKSNRLAAVWQLHQRENCSCDVFAPGGSTGSPVRRTHGPGVEEDPDEPSREELCKALENLRRLWTITGVLQRAPEEIDAVLKKAERSESHVDLTFGSELKKTALWLRKLSEKDSEA